MKKVFFVLLIALVSGVANAQYGSGSGAGGGTDYSGKPQIIIPEDRDPVTAFWDNDHCLYTTSLPGKLEDWNYDRLDYIRVDRILPGVNNNVVTFYITYSDWVNLGKPQTLRFELYNKNTITWRTEVMYIPTGHHPGGMILE